MKLVREGECPGTLEVYPDHRDPFWNDRRGVGASHFNGAGVASVSAGVRTAHRTGAPAMQRRPGIRGLS